MNSKINQDTISKALWSACDTFRGIISAGTHKGSTLTILFLKYISDVWQDHYDEYKRQYGDAPGLIEAVMVNECFVLPKSASFYALYERRHESGNGEHIDQALHVIEEANGTKLKDAGESVFQDTSFDTDRPGEEKQKNTILCQLPEDFAGENLNLKLSRIGTLDVIGNTYEYLVKNFATSGGQKTGGPYTSPEVSGLVTGLPDPQPGDTICDPACGSDSLLVKYGRKIVFGHDSRNYTSLGQEATDSTWSLVRVNIFLHGKGNHKTERGDTIRSPKLLDENGDLMLFDIVTANPSFNLDKRDHDKVENDKFGRFHHGIPLKTKGDYAFILHMIETLKPGTGRMGVVVPHGVLFRGFSEGKIRQKLIDENLLDTVVDLPEKLFYGTGIPAAILIFKKYKVDDKVLPIDASREYKTGKNQNWLGAENIQKIINIYHEDGNVEKYAYFANLKETQDNDCNLNIPRYVDAFEEEDETDSLAVRAEHDQLKAELAELEMWMTSYLEELGYGA